MIGWWRRRKRQWDCFHHDHRTGLSWLRVTAVWEEGVKVHLCSRCDRMFIR